ncbi:hypothetical protein Csa_015998, partial [Cucumis sativus]
GTPGWVLESHWLSALTIKYLKECGVGKKLQSLSMPIQNDTVSNGNYLVRENFIKLHHSVLSEGIEL